MKQFLHIQNFNSAARKVHITSYHTPCVQMSAVGITENVKGDNKKFEVWYNGREEVYIIQVLWENRIVHSIKPKTVKNHMTLKNKLFLVGSPGNILDTYNLFVFSPKKHPPS